MLCMTNATRLARVQRHLPKTYCMMEINLCQREKLHCLGAAAFVCLRPTLDEEDVKIYEPEVLPPKRVAFNSKDSNNRAVENPADMSKREERELTEEEKADAERKRLARKAKKEE